MKVSLKQTKNNKQGKLSKALRPGIRDSNNNSLPLEVENQKQTNLSNATESVLHEIHNSPED